MIRISYFLSAAIPYDLYCFLLSKSPVFPGESPVFPVGIYLIKVYNRDARERCEICSKFTIKTPERRYWRRSGAFIVNFEHISHLVLVFLLLTFSR